MDNRNRKWAIIICNICEKLPCDNRCPNADGWIVLGHCAECGEEITDEYVYYVDDEGNMFCVKDCAIKYHGIVEMNN